MSAHSLGSTWRSPLDIFDHLLVGDGGVDGDLLPGHPELALALGSLGDLNTSLLFHKLDIQTKLF